MSSPSASGKIASRTPEDHDGSVLEGPAERERRRLSHSALPYDAVIPEILEHRGLGRAQVPNGVFLEMSRPAGPERQKRGLTRPSSMVDNMKRKLRTSTRSICRSYEPTRQNVIRGPRVKMNGTNLNHL